jgi:hypothetical protein
MKKTFKFILAVAVFTVTTLVSTQNANARKGASSGAAHCDSSDAECGMDLKGNQICGKLVNPC